MRNSGECVLILKVEQDNNSFSLSFDGVAIWLLRMYPMRNVQFLLHWSSIE